MLRLFLKSAIQGYVNRTAVFKFPELSMYLMVLFAMMQENNYAKMINNMACIENKRSEQSRENGINFRQYGIIRLTNPYNQTLPNILRSMSGCFEVFKTNLAPIYSFHGRLYSIPKIVM